VSTGCNTVSR